MSTIAMVRRFVETTYSLDLGPAQVTQLNKAISNGADKGTFYLPKGTPMHLLLDAPSPSLQRSFWARQAPPEDCQE